MPAPKNTNGNGTQSDRIAALEEGYRNIGREVGGLREDFALFARDVRGELHERASTKWSPLIAAAAVVVAVVGGLVTLGASGPLSTIDRVVERMQEDDEREKADAYADGKRDAKIEILEKYLPEPKN